MTGREDLFAVGSRVRASCFGEWMNGTVLAVPMPDVALIEFDNGAKVHVLVSRLREPVDEMRSQRRRLTRNAAECGRCGTVIESKHRHDFVSCECEAIFVDGGLVYQRGGFDKPENFIDRSEWTHD